jgi:CheY-like chemotaxis protein
LQVESAPEEGSTFRVFLPARPGEVAKPATPSPVSELQGSGTVLFVDDEEMVRRTAFYSLQHFGYEVLQAENGRQAVDLFSKMTSRVALVILDMTMPVMGGAEALMEIRKISRSVPVVLTSGFDQPEAMRKFNGQSLAGFLQKPFTAKALAEIVKKAMDR